MATEKTVNISSDDNIQQVTSTQRSSSENVRHAQTKEADQAAQFLAGVGPFPPMTSEQEKKLVRKIDRWMIPLVKAPI